MMDTFALAAAAIFTLTVLYTLNWYLEHNRRRYR